MGRQQTYAGALASAIVVSGSIASAETLPTIAPQHAGFSDERLMRIEEFFNREIGLDRVPGAVVGIARDGKLVYLKAFGYRDKAKNLPMQTDTIFGLASMTKPMVAVGALALTEQGKLPLFSSLATYIPEFSTMTVAVPGVEGALRTEPQKQPITIQDLLRHTSGLTYGGRPDSGSAIAELYPSGSALSKMNSSAEFIAAITKLPLVHQPGTVWEYSESFDVLGSLIERLSGKSLGGYLADTIWKPLGMTDTGFHIDAAKSDRVAKAFPLDPLTGKPQKIVTTEDGVKFECGGGCAIGTVVDYMRFGQMLLNGGVLDDKRILSPHMVRLMTSNHLSASIKNNVANVETHRAGYGFGLGVAVRVEDGVAAVPASVGEYTWNGAYGTGFFADPKERLLVVFGTAAPGQLRKYYREQIQDLVYGAMIR